MTRKSLTQFNVSSSLMDLQKLVHLSDDEVIFAVRCHELIMVILWLII